MMSRTQKVRRNTTVVATLTAVTALAATIFAPAGFGRSLSSAAFWDTQPVIVGVPPTTAPGQDLPCAVAFEAHPETADPAGVAAGSPAGSATKNVTVYSDPPGAVSFSGTVSGSSAVIPAHVAADAAPGTVTVFIQTDDSAPATATTLVTSG